MNIKSIEYNNIITFENIKFLKKNEFINKLFCGDALEVLKLLPDNLVHLIITSPPYNVGISYDNYNDSLPYNEYLSFLNKIWKECYRVLVYGGRICINIPSISLNKEYKALHCDVISQMNNLGYIIRNDIIWYKQNIHKRTAWGSWKSPSNPYVTQPYEYILVFSKGSKKLEGNKDKIDITKEEFIKFSNSFWHITPEKNHKEHPAPFPQELVYRLIKFYSYQENIILDPFGGSGTVASVALKNNRKYIYIDNSMKYCKLAQKKLYYQKVLY